MTGPIVLDADHVRDATPWSALRDAIAEVLRTDDAVAPERHVHDLALGGGASGALLLMPSWIPGDVVAVKTVTFVPGNAAGPLPTVHAVVVLFDGADGRTLAVLDGDELTARRTAAISTLAADILSRPDAARLLVVGTGQLAPRMAAAYADIRSLEAVDVWGRNRAAAEEVAAGLRASGLPARAADDLDGAVRAADIVTCVTGSTAPLVHGEDLRPGAHLDLVGSFRPDMREADDRAVGRATVFVDTRAGALQSGDLAQPLAGRVITESAIAADLRGLVRAEHHGRTDDDEITLFKSAGFALADLAAARLAWRGAPA